MKDVEHSIAGVEAIRTMGVSIAIDNFGARSPRSVPYPSCRWTHCSTAARNRLARYEHEAVRVLVEWVHEPS
jgi:hypothetical protein